MDEFEKHKSRHVDGHTLLTVAETHVDSSYASGSPAEMTLH